ncbi:type II toxin-antitoxin system VapC family toxin [Aquibium oceanicum]|uniref:Ribonuclease VapC n=1 Tax=Aquibium oceanicum TaxID=1670800 RepID=A0A1L3SWK3_9HYPH|nr:type II toxin-antitoxin system VapC family toxin [Aquibium oceanicum]APH73778.1 VapC toxin family PIN domain ribonuclease [Aquibium oceanicum]
MTGKLLLDTCAIIWIATNEPIRPEAKSAIDAAVSGDDKVRVSPISAWELGLLSAKGRMPTALPPSSLFRDVAMADGVRVEALSPEVLIASSFLPGTLHRDPADRILIATARAHDLAIVTRDRIILDYAGQGHVKAVAC